MDISLDLSNASQSTAALVIAHSSTLSDAQGQTWLSYLHKQIAKYDIHCLGDAATQNIVENERETPQAYIQLD